MILTGTSGYRGRMSRPGVLALPWLLACSRATPTPLPEDHPPPPPSASAPSPPAAAARPAAPALPVPADRVIGCGHTFACVLAKDGGVRCWGRNEFGQLGVGTRGWGVFPPVAVKGLPPARSVVVGLHHACALTAAGEVWCWGAAYDGQRGDGAPIPDPEARGPEAGSPGPVRVPGLGEPAVSLDAGMGHTCAVLASGRVACWGDNLKEQLGSPGPSRSTAQVVAGVEEAAEVAAGIDLTCARRKDGEVRCWGALGSGPGAPIPDLCATQITAGMGFACALDCAGAPVCWGTWPAGGKGPGVTPVPGGVARAVEIRAGYWHVCFRDPLGVLSCWGGNDSGQLGQPPQKDWWQDWLDTPRPVKGSWKRTEAVCAGGMMFHPGAAHRRAATWGESGKTCAVDEGGGVFCWGEPNVDFLPRRVGVGR